MDLYGRNPGRNGSQSGQVPEWSPAGGEPGLEGQWISILCWYCCLGMGVSGVILDLGDLGFCNVEWGLVFLV